MSVLAAIEQNSKVEQFYRVQAVAQRLGLSTDTVIRLFEHEDGVAVLSAQPRRGKKINRRCLLIPESVILRVMEKLSRH